MSQINILFVDDHPLIRKAWKFVISQNPRFKIIGICDGGEQAVEACRHSCPDIVIMDIRMRGISGIEATEMILSNCPDAKIIGLSFHCLPEYAKKIMESGARGYLTKSSSPEEIFKAILEVYEGRTYICKEIKEGTD